MSTRPHRERVGDLQELHPHVLAQYLKGFIIMVPIGGVMYDAQFIGSNTADGNLIVKIIRKRETE